MRNEPIILFSFLMLLALIFHSFVFRGRYLTLVFFIFVLFWGSVKEFFGPHIQFSFNNKTGLEYLLNKALVINGWAITFYLGWSISEAILIRINKSRENIFSILLLSCSVIASIAYFIESAATSVGWWQWNARKVVLNNDFFTTHFFVGTSLKVVQAWAYFGFIFLFSYFFIFFISNKFKNFKYVFYSLPFISILAIRWAGPCLELFFLFAFLFVFIFSRYVKLACSPLETSRHILKTGIILEHIPVFILAFMMLTVVYCLVVIKQTTYPLISLLPALFLLLYALKSIPQRVIFLLIVPVAILAREKMVPLVCVMFLIMILQYEKLLFLFKRIKGRNNL